MNEELARKIVEKVLCSLTGRSGFDGAWDSIDDDIQEEIKDDLVEVVLKTAEENND